MFPVTITLHNIADLTAVMKAIGSTAVVLEESTPFVKMADAVADPSKLADAKQARTEAPGKPAASTAPSPRTAEAAPSPSAPPAAAPATQTTATEPAAAASSVSADKPVAYADLQKAVLTLHKMDPSAAVPIAKSLGADTFKGLVSAASLKDSPNDSKGWTEIRPGVWAEALRLVNEAIEARKAA